MQCGVQNCCYCHFLAFLLAFIVLFKGVFTKESNLNKAREHPLLLSKRPPYVTILTLVRDAAARLPNGEGTRAEVRLNFMSLSRLIIPQKRKIINQDNIWICVKPVNLLDQL